MPADRSSVKRLFDRVERAVGEPLEQATHSDRFADLLSLTVGVAAAVRRAYERATADALHRANLPAWSDLVWLSRRLATLERRVADLSTQLERSERSVTREQRGSRRRPAGEFGAAKPATRASRARPPAAQGS